MGIFASSRDVALPTHPEARAAELTEQQRVALPPRFEAVGEALVSGWDTVESCVVAGRELALDGCSLDEALMGLAATWRLVRRREPSYTAARALSVAWSEATLDYLHQLTCTDPVTGLASLAHLQSRVSELYRGQLRDSTPADTHALVVIDTHHGSFEEEDIDGRRGAVDVFAGDLRAARMAETTRTVFAGDQTLGLLGGRRLVVITHRDERLGQRVALVQRLLDQPEAGAARTRVWIEGLPPSETAAASVLAELARL